MIAGTLNHGLRRVFSAWFHPVVVPRDRYRLRFVSAPRRQINAAIELGIQRMLDGYPGDPNELIIDHRKITSGRTRIVGIFAIERTYLREIRNRYPRRRVRFQSEVALAACRNAEDSMEIVTVSGRETIGCSHGRPTDSRYEPIDVERLPDVVSSMKVLRDGISVNPEFWRFVADWKISSSRLYPSRSAKPMNHPAITLRNVVLLVSLVSVLYTTSMELLESRRRTDTQQSAIELLTSAVEQNAVRAEEYESLSQQLQELIHRHDGRIADLLMDFSAVVSDHGFLPVEMVIRDNDIRIIGETNEFEALVNAFAVDPAFTVRTRSISAGRALQYRFELRLSYGREGELASR